MATRSDVICTVLYHTNLPLKMRSNKFQPFTNVFLHRISVLQIAIQPFPSTDFILLPLYHHTDERQKLSYPPRTFSKPKINPCQILCPLLRAVGADVVLFDIHGRYW